MLIEAISTGWVASFSYKILPLLASTAMACFAATSKSWAATVVAEANEKRVNKVKIISS